MKQAKDSLYKSKKLMLLGKNNFKKEIEEKERGQIR